MQTPLKEQGLSVYCVESAVEAVGGIGSILIGSGATEECDTVELDFLLHGPVDPGSHWLLVLT